MVTTGKDNRTAAHDLVPDQYKDLGDDAPFVEMLTEENTRKAVQDQVKLKADFIKIWYIVLDKDIEQGARKNFGAGESSNR
jgi:hypothetical protein